MQLLTTIMYSSFKIKRTLGESIMDEFRDIGRSIGDFFSMIKEVTYDVLVDKYGSFSVNLLGIGIIFAIVIFVCLAFINR